MSPAARSMVVHGVFLAVSGITFIAVPNMVFGLLGMPPSNEVWVRLVGVLTLILGFYFIQSARQEIVEFMRWTVYARFTFMFFCALFVLLKFVAPVLLLFGLADVLSAIWTARALRATA